VVLARTHQQPRSADRFVSRAALTGRLSAAAPGSVTLLCAPAGSGKTALLRSWAAELEEAVAWVTVERGERDPQRFWLHLIDALAGEWVPAARLLVDNYLALTMAGRGATLHTLLGVFPADAPLADENLAAALAIDSVLHGLLDQAAAHWHAARRLSARTPAERRRLFEAYLAVVALEIARRQSDLAKAQTAMAALEAALNATADLDELPVSPEYWTLSLMNLGVVELWADRHDAARAHLEDALDRTRRISRPFIEIGCLAHLAMNASLTGSSLARALELSERALAIAEEHGWASESMTTGAFAMAGMALVQTGRFGDAERHLARAQESLRVAADPGTEVVLHHVQGVLRFGEGRFEDALVEFARARRLEALLASEHVFALEARGRALQVRVRMGDAEFARRALAGMGPQERDRAAMRIALAALELERDEPEAAVQALAPVIDASAPALCEHWARAEALILDAAARDRLGDQRAVEGSLERALDLAEPERCATSTPSSRLTPAARPSPARAGSGCSPRRRAANRYAMERSSPARSDRAPQRMRDT
jgi:LuxR family transcriptional regulator, maltose regulon positive regulatory protein